MDLDIPETTMVSLQNFAPRLLYISAPHSSAYLSAIQDDNHDGNEDDGNNDDDDDNNNEDDGDDDNGDHDDADDILYIILYSWFSHTQHFLL